MDIVGAMEELAEYLRPHVSRPVVTDLRNLVPPAVLVTPPALESNGGVLCGAAKLTFTVWVVGLPGARAEFAPLAALVVEVVDALQAPGGPGYDSAFPDYFGAVDGAPADPSMAYRFLVEVFT